MPLITVRIDESTKARMDTVTINWSDAIRQAVSRILDEEARKNRIRAAQLNDRIRVTVPPGFDSTRLIREGRDGRYGLGRRR
jgi:Arc/MetJ-type ribon-helix-helix transcriptional regulator